MKRRIAAGLLLILLLLPAGCNQNGGTAQTAPTPSEVPQTAGVHEDDAAQQPVLSSGTRKEKEIEIKVELPADIPEAKLEVYVDGTLDASRSTTADTSFKTSVTFTFKGTQGTRDVRIKLNGQPYKSYEINFDDSSFREIEN